MRELLATIVVAVPLVAATSVAAQTEPEEESSPEVRASVEIPRTNVSIGGESVSLSSLLRHAERHAPALAVAEARVGLADEARGAAAPLLPSNPSVLVGVGPRFGANTSVDANVLVNLLVPFEIAGERPLRFDVARAARTTRERTRERIRWQVHQDIHSGYRKALALRHNAELSQRLSDFSAQLVDIATRRVRAGDASPLTERLAVADAAQARQRAIAALQDYRDACLRLAEVAGWSAEHPPEPEGELAAPRRAPALGTLLETAGASNPTLAELRAAVGEARARSELAARDGWPEPSIGARYIYEGAPGGGVPEHVVMGMLQLPFPLSQRNQAERARTTAQVVVSEAEQDALSDVLAVRLERLRTAVDAAAERVEAFGQDILPRFEENLVMLRRAFELGEIDLLRLSLAVERFLSVQQQSLEAYATYFSAVAALEAEVGQEIWEDDR
jgi:cobalt-zinc-cadmium efflux system outer membrane protein